MPFYITILYALSIILMGTIGILVFRRNANSPVNRSFIFFTLSSTLWIIFLYAGYAVIGDDLELSAQLFRVAFSASILLIFSFFLFFYYFPKKIFTLPKWLQAILYGGIAIFAGVTAFTTLIEESVAIVDGVPTDTFGPLYDTYLLYTLITFLFVIILVFWKIRIIEGLDKKKLTLVASGFLTFFFLAMMTNVVLPIFGIFILQAESVSFLLFFFVAVLFAAYRQRFFNLAYISLQLLRSILVFFFFGCFVALYFVILHEIFAFFDFQINIAIAITLAFITYRWIEKKFPQFYTSSFQSFRNHLYQLQADTFDCQTYQEFSDLIKEVFMEKLNIKSAEIHIMNMQGMGDHIPLYKNTKFSKKLEKIKDVLVAEELESDENMSSKKKQLLQEMKKLNCALCFPLKSEGKLIGSLSLGPKRKGKELYSKEEITEMLKVIPSLEVSLMNILITDSLREENDVMKKIIHARTKTLKRNNKKLEEMIEQQNNFISLTAHEFRTPLTVAMLGLEQISYTHKGNVSKELAEDIETSHEQLNKLTNLINRLLEMRRVDDDKIPLNMEEINIVKFTTDIAKGMNLLAKKSDMSVTYSGPKKQKVIIKTDAVKLKEVVDNLVQNAIKFSKKGGKIEITLRISKKEEKAIIKVRDYGRGIAKKDQKIIFDKFQQGSQYNQGVGIGLYLCKKYMQLLSGDISVSSKRGHGATFTVDIPLT